MSRPGNSPSGVRIKPSSNEWRLNALEHNSASRELRNCIFWLWLLFTYTNKVITVLAQGFLEVMQFLHRGQHCFNLKAQTLAEMMSKEHGQSTGHNLLHVTTKKISFEKRESCLLYTHTHVMKTKGLYIKEGAGFHAPQEESSKQAQRQKQAGLSQRRSPKERSSTTGRWQPFTSLNERRQGNILISPSREDCYCLEIFLGLRQDDFWHEALEQVRKTGKGSWKNPHKWCCNRNAWGKAGLAHFRHSLRVLKKTLVFHSSNKFEKIWEVMWAENWCASSSHCFCVSCVRSP